VARPRDVPGLDCEETFSLAAARVIEVRAGEVFEHASGVLDLDDIEPLHNMRVASRRLRAALEVFRPCFPRQRRKQALRKVKALADALGERRDRDVSIAFLAGFLEEAPTADRERLEIILARLREEQLEANEALAPFLAEERLGELRDALSGLVEEAKKT
jgi:CHAD domain-containing protein